MKVEYAIERFVGLSPDMRVARKRVEMAIRANENVLISGPPGSGREFVARMIHVSSDTWGSTPLVPLSCPLLDDELLESTIAELMQRCGELELEHPPSLLLLDVDQLSEVAQHSLQGILSIGELELRTLATSSMSSAVLQQRNDFRRDLAVMLATVDIDLPPLVQRKQDIALLIQAELERRNQQGTQQLQGVTREALEYWLAYDWPGNVDELLSTVEQACRLATGPWLDLAALPANLRHAQTAVKYPPQENEEIELDSYLQRIERELIVRALRKAKGNKAEAARLLGIARGRLLRRLSQLGLEGDAS
jgi:DNA-binding NtrC family response regulator